MSDITIALAGGAVGAVVTGTAAQVARAWAAWAEVTEHSRQADEHNERLLIWVDDRTRELVGEMERRTEDHNGRGLFHSSIHANSLIEAKGAALHEFRDQRARTDIALGALAAQEGAWHSFWRRLRRQRDRLSITVDDRAEPFLERWREPVTRHGDSATPLDRTRRTYTDALADLPNANLT